MEDMLGRVINIGDAVVYSHASQDGLTLGIVDAIKLGKVSSWHPVGSPPPEFLNIKVLVKRWNGKARAYELVSKKVVFYRGENLLILDDNHADFKQRIEDTRNA